MKSNRISFLLAACLLLVSSWAVAQAPANDILYLKDGSVIRGTLIESITGSHVRFKNAEGEVKQYPMAEVDRTSISGKNNRAAVELKRIGYSHISSLGVLIGQSLYYGNSANPSFQTINGVRIGSHWSVGIGTGLESFGMGAQMPLYAHGRYTPLKGNVSPFVDAMAGYAFSLAPQINYYDGSNSSTQAGITGGIGGGVKFMTSQRFGMTVGMGYRFQRMNRSYNATFWTGDDIGYYPVEERTDMHRIEARVGILFN
jgi:hypothetical protein